ncbi:MAG TPA: NAD(P)-dependent oxidoreductase [Streptosporangiaceae bacterium]|jgi:UDP-glucose 4-epimerase|nr:NAD(P)-dependent oxidoreductase [Streptosporangiaceae bacterium]
MILITGGLGFIGSHTTRALLDLGESCVVVQRRDPVLPGDLADEAGHRVFAEQADITDLAALLAIGERHKITGVVHLAGSVPWPPGALEPLEGSRLALGSLLNVLEAALRWDVPRVGLASTIGVYGGVTSPSPLGEDLPLPITGGHVIPLFKKVGELLGAYLAGATRLSVVNYRIAAIWGPGGRAGSPFLAAPALVHAAARGTAPDLSALRGPVYAGDGSDLCYVRDCGRAIALLQTAAQLSEPTYNVASGRLTTNADVVAAIGQAVPGWRYELPERGPEDGPDPGLYLDISRLTRDTGYQPAWDTGRAVADYIDWLRAGHER